MENYKQWMEQKLTSEDMDKLPKVRKPITEEELKEILFHNGWRSQSLEVLMPVVREVEKYHNNAVKPLTDKEIEGIRMTTAGDIKAFARAIEKAHGIV